MIFWICLLIFMASVIVLAIIGGMGFFGGTGESPPRRTSGGNFIDWML